MKLREKLKEYLENSKKKNAVQGGTYSLILSVIVIAICIVVNLFAEAIPVSASKIDISSTKLYSITSSTKVVVNALEDDVTIYWIVQSGEEDEVIENLLSKYESLSDHITVVKKNPDVYPTFAEQYTDGTVYNNSLVVESGGRYRYIDYYDIYVTESDMYTYTYTTSFDGEGAVTSAIDYVVSDDLPKMYLLEGHGERDLPSTFADQVEKENIETETLSLLTVDEIPEDADCIMIYEPESDLSEEEASMLEEYVEAGGKLLVCAGPAEDSDLANLNSILSSYGIESVEGVVIDEDREHYAFQTPYVLIPDVEDEELTESLSEGGYYVIMPISGGLDVGSADSSVTTLLMTSGSSFSKIAGYSLTTYEKEDGDIDGPFALGVSIEEDNDGQIIWYTSAAFLEDQYNAYASGANVDLVMNSLSSLIGEREGISIRSKSLNYSYLSISESTGSVLKAVMIGIIPIGYLLIGVVVVVMRRRKQNAAE